jgi:hypothetical protein
MVPKSGDLTQPSNWQPIAILPIFYKIFARIIYGRLRDKLDGQQCSDQTGFRSGIRLEEALVTLETLVSKTNEWHVPLFIASLDLKKAFDRVEHASLVDALLSQDVPDPYVDLIAELYNDQLGSADGSRPFQIARGVRQGDVLAHFFSMLL